MGTVLFVVFTIIEMFRLNSFCFVSRFSLLLVSNVVWPNLSDMLANLLAERNADPAAALRREAKLAARKIGFSLPSTPPVDDPMTACYIGKAVASPKVCSKMMC